MAAASGLLARRMYASSRTSHTRGCVRAIPSRVGLSSSRMSVIAAATTVAVRGRPERLAISPKKSPPRSWATA